MCPPELGKAVPDVPSVVELASAADVPSQVESDLTRERDRWHRLPAIGPGLDDSERAGSGNEAKTGQRYRFVGRLVADGRGASEIEPELIHRSRADGESIPEHGLLDALGSIRSEVPVLRPVDAGTK